MKNFLISSLLLLYILISGISMSVKAQLRYTGFENFADEMPYTQSSWISDGFSVQWVNGFDKERAYIDDAYVKSGTKSLRILYPAGKYGPVTTGSGAQAPLVITPADQYYISYWIRFSDTFSWGSSNEGGKLPGLAGGNRCSGCIACTGSNGFTARLMWRPGGKLVLYLYHLDKANPPCGDNIPLQLKGSDYYITKGQWFQITERVKVNTGTNHDGEVELWINEQPALLKTGIQFVSNGDKVDNFYFSTFHGGNDVTWAPAVDSYTWFDDIKISTNPIDIFSPLALERIKSTRKISSREEVLISPQPIRSGSDFSIDLSFKNIENYRLEWRTASGQLIRTEEVNSATGSLTAPYLTAGEYLLKMIFSDETITQKIIVER